MALSIMIVLAVLVALGLILWTVHRLRPERFHVRATVTKWASLDIEMECPRDPPHHKDAA